MSKLRGNPSTVKLFVVRRFKVNKAGGSNKNAPQGPEACYNILYFMQVWRTDSWNATALSKELNIVFDLKTERSSVKQGVMSVPSVSVKRPVCCKSGWCSY